jgi:hypothetical protein
VGYTNYVAVLLSAWKPTLFYLYLLLILKINFLVRDSILAVPIILDLALFMGLAQRARMGAFRGGSRSPSRAL